LKRTKSAWIGFYSRAAGHQQGNAISVELEKGFGNLTVELRFGYEIDKAPGESTHGWDSIKTGARYRFFKQSLSAGLQIPPSAYPEKLGFP